MKTSILFLLLPLTLMAQPRTGILKTSKGEMLLPCPDKKNCVVSHKEHGSHYIDPIKIISNKDHATKKIIGIIKKDDAFKLIKQEDNYIHATYTSSLMKFVDDVEFLFDSQNKLIHVRSASRTGYYDFEANKKRIEEIRFKFHQNDF